MPIQRSYTMGAAYRIAGTLTLLILINPASAAEIDLFGELSQRTAPRIANRVSEICRNPFVSCFGVRFRNVRLIPVKVDYSDVRPDALPTQILRQTFVFRNC